MDDLSGPDYINRAIIWVKLIVFQSLFDSISDLPWATRAWRSFRM